MSDDEKLRMSRRARRALAPVVAAGAGLALYLVVMVAIWPTWSHVIDAAIYLIWQLNLLLAIRIAYWRGRGDETGCREKFVNEVRDDMLQMLGGLDGVVSVTKYQEHGLDDETS